MTKDKELLPCPFCGRKPVLSWDDRGGDHWWCENPSCPIGYVNITEEAWNTRATPAAAAQYVLAESAALVTEVKVLKTENEMLKRENARLDDLNKRILESMARSNSVDWTRWAKPNPVPGDRL